FRLQLTDPKLYVAGPVGIVGARELCGPTGLRLYSDVVFPRPKPLPVVVGEKQRVVWPEADPGDAVRRVYPEFATAYAALKPGETLLLAVNGAVEVKSLPEVKNLSAVIRPYPGYSPELVPDPGFRDPSLIRLTDGELTFENLTLRLSDRKYVVGLAGGKLCQFRHCTITLDDKEGEPPALVAVLDMSKEPRMGPVESATPPTIRLSHCLVRGKGRGLWFAAARPVTVVMENAAFALDGSLAVIEPPARDTPSGAIELRLTRVTTFLTGSLFELREPRDTTGRVVPLNVTTQACLFAPAVPTRPRPLVVIADGDPTTDPRRYLNWDTNGTNIYANVDRLSSALEIRSSIDDVASATYDLARWREFSRDRGPELRVSFQGKGLRSKLGMVRPADLKAERADETAPTTRIDAGMNPLEFEK
ncbi:MAG: hypothetical protein ACRCZF_15130, partial [Gemmataceae bacterium]